VTAFRLFLHILAASVWVGGQIVMAGILPTTRRLEPESRVAVATAFGRVAWIALAVAVLTGLWNVMAIPMDELPHPWVELHLLAVLVTAAMDEAGKSAWCRERGVYPQELEQWRQAATQALAEPEDARASHRETKADRRRIKELECELRRKDKALAETAALLVLSKKLEVIFHKDRDEDA